MSQPVESTNRRNPEDYPSTPNDSLKGDPLLSPRNEKTLSYEPETIDKAKVLLPPSTMTKWTLTATIAGGWLLALIFAIVHWRYGVLKDDHTISSTGNGTGLFTSGGQDSVKTAVNALTRATVLSLTLASGAILTQMAWRIPSRRPVTLDQLDSIFRVPSPLSTVGLLFSSLFRYILPIALLVLCVQILELVTVMAPQSLKVAPGKEYIAQASVQALDFSQSPVTSADIFSGGYVGPSAMWIRTVQKAMMAPEGVVLVPPPNCEAGCEYNITYNAPALQCRDLAASDLTPLETSGTKTLYTGSSSLWPSVNSTDVGPLVPYFTNNPNDHTTAYTIRIQYSGLEFNSNSPASSTPDAPLGVECDFVDATYTSLVWFNGTIQYLEPTIVTFGQTLVGQLANQQGCSLTPDADQPCWVTGTNYRATAEAFSRLILGTIIYNDSGVLQITSGTPNLLPLFDTDTTLTGQTVAWTFNRTVPSISDSLQEMLCNVTMGLITVRNDFVNANVTYTSGGITWSFDDWVLWSIYGPTLGVFLIFAVWGIWLIWKDGAVDSKFSDFLIATRGTTIDHAVNNAADRERIRSMRMKYAKSGTFEVAENENKSAA